MIWVIAGEKDPETLKTLYWSNVYGWTTLADADRFSNDEKNRLRLPIGGHWVGEFRKDPIKKIRGGEKSR